MSSGEELDSAFLEVEREIGGVTDHLRVYEVVVDGMVVGRLHPGETLTVEVGPGLHELFIKIDWARSDKVNIEVAPRETARFRCAPRANLLTDLYWATIGRHQYIRLNQVVD